MIIQEFYKTRNDGKVLYKTYSNNDFCIKQIETGQIYDEAIDVYPIMFTYEETEEKIEKNVVGVDYAPDYEER